MPDRESLHGQFRDMVWWPLTGQLHDQMVERVSDVLSIRSFDRLWQQLREQYDNQLTAQCNDSVTRPSEFVDNLSGE
jgi:hypothetical protein